jgi:hypothetical protein
MGAREMRFAVRADHGCSPHWKVRVGATRSDVYVSKRSTGSIFHVSLHENPDHWHIKGRSRSSGDSQEVWLRWDRPNEFAPGFVRALDLTVTPAVIDKPLGHRKQTYWYQFPGPERWVQFNVWLEHPLANRDDSWPGKRAMGTQLVGRLPLSSGWTVCVVAHDEPGGTGQANFKTQGLRDLWRTRKQLLGSNGAQVASFHRLDDGSIGIIHGRFEGTPAFRSPTWWVRWARRKLRRIGRGQSTR